MRRHSDWLDAIEAHTLSQAKYDREHTKGIYMKLNLRTDSDIIQWTRHQDSVQGAIKKLIREDIQRKNGHRQERGSCNEIEI